MHYRKLGRTGLMVSEVGLGGAGLGHVFGESTDQDAYEAVDYALAEGINYFDVAPAYGHGRAEENLGKALSGRRQQTVIATKILLQPHDLDDIRGAVERGLQASLSRLQTDYVDVFQLHNLISRERGGVTQRTAMGDLRRSISLRDVMGADGAVQALQRLKETDAVRFVGFTGVGEAEAIREVMRDGDLDTVQVYYNLLNTSAAEPLPPGSTLHDHGQILPLAAELGIGAIGIRNLAGGALSAAIDRPVDSDSLIGCDLQRAIQLDFLTQDGRSLSQVAARFVLQQPTIATVIPGVKTRAEVEDALAAIDLPPLTEDERARLSALAGDDFGVAGPAGAVM